MRKWSIRGLIFSALFAGIMITMIFLKFALPFSTVPITLQTLAVMLAGSLLGARYGTLAILIVIGLAAAGFPVLGGRGGLSVLIGPTGGYIFSWPFAALLIGLFAQRMQQNKFTFLKLITVNFIFGALLVYPGGVSWLAYTTGIDTVSKALVGGMWPFIPGDLVKSVLAASVVVAVWKVYPIERVLNNGYETWLEEKKSPVGR